MRLFGFHRDVNDAHRTGANGLQNKQQQRCFESRISAVRMLRLIIQTKRRYKKDRETHS